MASLLSRAASMRSPSSRGTGILGRVAELVSPPALARDSSPSRQASPQAPSSSWPTPAVERPKKKEGKTARDRRDVAVRGLVEQCVREAAGRTSSEVCAASADPCRNPYHPFARPLHAATRCGMLDLISPRAATMQRHPQCSSGAEVHDGRVDLRVCRHGVHKRSPCISVACAGAVGRVHGLTRLRR